MKAQGEREKILIVDDSELCRRLATVILERAGYVVVSLGSPFGYAAAVRRERPALVLLDVAMPGLRGDQLASIRPRETATPSKDASAEPVVLLYSDRSDEELAALVQACGAAGYIRKSQEAEELVSAIARHLAPGWKRPGASTPRGPQ
jgi:CheY-like chemotaxis protein